MAKKPREVSVRFAQVRLSNGFSKCHIQRHVTTAPLRVRHDRIAASVSLAQGRLECARPGRCRDGAAARRQGRDRVRADRLQPRGRRAYPASGTWDRAGGDARGADGVDRRLRRPAGLLAGVRGTARRGVCLGPTEGGAQGGVADVRASARTVAALSPRPPDRRACRGSSTAARRASNRCFASRCSTSSRPWWSC